MEIKLEYINCPGSLINLNYTFQNNHITTIMADNASTKETLIKLLLGIESPITGVIHYGSRVITKQNAKIILDQISYTYPFPNEQLYCKTVSKELDSSHKYTEEEKINFLNKVGLTKDYLHQNPFHLSLGEQAKLTFAISLSKNPDIYIFDEPTRYLDYQSTQILITLIKELQKQGKTIIILSNNINFSLELNSDILVIFQAKLYLSTTAKDIQNNPTALTKAGIALPPILEFITLANHTKNAKLTITYEIQELMKDIYRHVS